MQYRLLKILGLLLFAVVFGSAVAEAEIIPGQAVVRLGQGNNPGSAFSGTGVTVIDSIPELRMYLVKFPSTIPFESKRLELLGRSGVSGVSANEPVDLIESHQMSIDFPEDNVPVFVKGEEPQNYYEQPAVYSIGLDSAQLITQGMGVRVAVIDNGIDRSHPVYADFNDSLSHDFVENDADPSEGEGLLRGHGTFVAGLIHLAAPEAELLVIRAFDGSGVSTTFRAAQALNWAVCHNANVVNMSFGTVSDNSTLAQACARAVQAGVVLVASAGNDGAVQPIYPASYPGVIAVSAIDAQDVIAWFSNGSADIDVCAPGVSIYGPLPLPYYWGTWSGTSFSAPLVAASAVLVEAVHPGMLPRTMEEHIRETAQRDLAWGVVTAPDPFYGYGRIDAFTAVLLFRLGDMDNSGTLDVTDLSVVTTTATGGTLPANAIHRQADVDCDGDIDSDDVDQLSQRLFGGGGGQ